MSRNSQLHDTERTQYERLRLLYFPDAVAFHLQDVQGCGAAALPAIYISFGSNQRALSRALCGCGPRSSFPFRPIFLPSKMT